MSPDFEGFGKEITRRAYPTVGVPLLQMFYLRFTEETVDLQKPAGSFVFVLSGFTFYFRGNDQHVDQLSVTEANGRLSVAFNDDERQGDVPVEGRIRVDPFRPGPEHESGARRSRTRRCSAHHSGRLAGDPGFSLDFRNYFTRGQDHHLREVGVMTRWPANDFLEVYFADKNGDDGFDWEVRLAYLADRLDQTFSLPDNVGVISTN